MKEIPFEDIEYGSKEKEKKMEIRYKVIIDTLGEVYFSEIRAPENTHEPIEYRAGAETPKKMITSEMMMRSNAVFMRGVCTERKVIDWILESLTGYITPHQIKVILVSDNNRIPAIEWTLTEAFPLKYSMPYYKEDADTVEIEFLEIVYDQLIRIK